MHKSFIQPCASGPDHRVVHSTSPTGLRRRASLLVLATASPPYLPQGHLDTVYSVTWSPDGTALASGSGDKTIRLWAAVSGQCTAVLEVRVLCMYTWRGAVEGMAGVKGKDLKLDQTWEGG